MIAAWLLALVVEPPIVNETCDVIEVNTVYCGDSGRECFKQLIFWRAEWPDARLQVREWRMVKSPSQYPTLVGKEWRAIVAEEQGLIMVRAPLFRETWTPFDPELQARDELPERERRKLRSQ